MIDGFCMFSAAPFAFACEEGGERFAIEASSGERGRAG
jgi:hypothetical protein